MTNKSKLFATLGALAIALNPAAGATLASDAPPATVPDFALLDHEGRFHKLYSQGKDPGTHAIVLIVQGNGCPLVRKRVPYLKRLRDEYAPKGVVFRMLNANPQDGRADIAAEAREFDIDLPILKDETQLVARTLGITRTAEAILIEPRTWSIAYRGAIDDRLDYQAQKPEAQREYLKEALDASLEGKPIPSRVTRAPGCAITFEEAKADVLSPLTYS